MNKKKEKKYANLGELAEAFRSGELDRNVYSLMLDNDCSSLCYRGPLPEGMDPDSDEYDEFIDEKETECSEWFNGNGVLDIEDACVALGIPCEWSE
jgi:hypothetical protein